MLLATQIMKYIKLKILTGGIVVCILGIIQCIFINYVLFIFNR